VNLAGLLAARDKAAALQHAQEAVRLAPDSLEARLALAEALAANERRAEALAIYRQTRQGMPEGSPLLGAVEARIRELQRGRP